MTTNGMLTWMIQMARVSFGITIRTRVRVKADDDEHAALWEKHSHDDEESQDGPIVAAAMAWHGVANFVL